MNIKSGKVTKLLCTNCKLVMRRKMLYRICTNPRHKARQG